MVLLDRANRVGRSPDRAILLPGAAGAFGLGAVAAQSPLLGAGIGTLTLLGLLPWTGLYALLVLASLFNKTRLSVGPVSLQVGHIVLVPLTIRVFMLTRKELRPRWRAAEWALVGFIALEFFSSFVHSRSFQLSAQSAGLLLLGAIVYLGTYVAVVTRRRLVFAVRTFLVGATINASVALLALAAHVTMGTHWGVGGGQAGFTPARGLAFEHDILGSMTASAAMVFLLLSREENPVVSRSVALLGFWVSFLGMLAGLARGPWIGFAVALFVVLLLRRPRIGGRRRFSWIAIASLILGLGGLGVTSVIVHSESLPQGAASSDVDVVAKGAEIVNFSSGSGAARVSEARFALGQVLHRSPLTGLGTNSYGQNNPDLGSQGKPAYLGDLYLRSLYDTGLIGLGLLLVFLLGVVRPTVAIRYSRGDLAPVALAMVGGYLVLAVAYAATDASQQIWPWIILGLARVASTQASVQFRQSRAVVHAGSARRRGHPGSPTANGDLHPAFS
jgi:hypothetical protein